MRPAGPWGGGQFSTRVAGKAIYFRDGSGVTPKLLAELRRISPFLGIKLSPPRSAKNAPVISTDASRVAVPVIRTDEELMIARSVSRVLKLGSSEEI